MSSTRSASDGRPISSILGGFLSLLSIPPDYVGRVINIHPSLIPAFCGKGFHGEAVHRAALSAGVKISGCTVHFADDTYDTGPIISQTPVPILDDDTPHDLAARVFSAECDALPRAISLFAQVVDCGSKGAEAHPGRSMPDGRWPDADPQMRIDGRRWPRIPHRPSIIKTRRAPALASSPGPIAS